MKLTEEQAITIVKKVHEDLKLDYGNKYPIVVNFLKKKDKVYNYDFDSWGGFYDYRNPEAVGDDSWGKYTEWIITIDDEKGEAISYHHYTGHYQIQLNKEGKYEVVKQLNRGD